jgi:hypothetical protein
VRGARHDGRARVRGHGRRRGATRLPRPSTRAVRRCGFIAASIRVVPRAHGARLNRTSRRPTIAGTPSSTSSGEGAYALAQEPPPLAKRRATVLERQCANTRGGPTMQTCGAGQSFGIVHVSRRPPAARKRSLHTFRSPARDVDPAKRSAYAGHVGKCARLVGSVSVLVVTFLVFPSVGGATGMTPAPLGYYLTALTTGIA